MSVGAIGGARIAAGAQTGAAAKLEVGKPVERDLSGTREDAYDLALPPGQCATLIVEQRGIDVVVRVRDAAGALVMELDSESRREGRESAILVAQSAADYRIIVRARYSRDPAGRYEIRVGELRPATDGDRDLFSAHRFSTEAATLVSAGKPRDALDRATRALELGERSLGPDAAFVGELLVPLAELRRATGDMASAERLFQRAVGIDRAALGRDNVHTATAMLRLGALYNAQEDYPKAEPLLLEALAATERVLGPVHPRVASCLLVVSLVHSNRQDYARALPELERALSIDEATLEPTDLGVLAIQTNLGDMYAVLEDYDRGEALLTRALAGLEKLLGPTDTRLAIPLQDLGTIARTKKQYSRALELLSRAEQIRERTLGPRHAQTAMLLINIGNVYCDQHDYARARDNFVRALDVLETAAGPYNSATMMAVSSIGRTYIAEGEPARALEYEARVDRILEKNAELNLTMGSEREKLAYFNSAMERASRTVSLNVRLAPGNAAAAALAATVVEQRKGRVLDAMADSLTALRRRMDPGDSAALDRLTATTSQFAALALKGPGRTPFAEYEQRLTSLDEAREQLEADVAARSAAFRAQSQPVTLAGLQAAIPADAALIEFVVYHPFDPHASVDSPAQFGAPRYIAYVLRQHEPVQWRELGPADTIDTAVAQLRGALRDPKRDDVTQKAREVDRLVMQPIRTSLPNVARLLVSPDGELNLIPFEALVDEHGHYLVERYAVSYLTAGRDLLRLQVPRSSQSEPVIIADPFFAEPDPGSTQARSTKTTDASRKTARRSTTMAKDLSRVYFARLPGTGEEARRIQSLFPAAHMLTGARATKAALQHLDAPSILHIATHGFFLQQPEPDPTVAAGAHDRAVQGPLGGAPIENPLLRSGLALAGANGRHGANNDGILTALEAANLNLWGTKLVTLSACDTGVGEVRSGEGVYGLRRAFVLAGAETLVMSLWPISDYVTREMMDEYYRGLKNGLGRGDALRHAQLAMLAKPGRRQPFYWASFIQAGEWATLDGRR